VVEETPESLGRQVLQTLVVVVHLVRIHQVREMRPLVVMVEAVV
tara:strand:+ start:399 stop:530 length:132 start_codon:yes stop_codon:yes gene_type:complete